MKNSKKKSGNKKYNKEVYPLRVLGKTYWVTVIDQPELAIDGARVYGVTNNKQQHINLDRNQGFDQIRETLLHELIHVWEGSFKITIKHEDVYSLAVFLYSVMKDNPKLVNWLMEKADESK